jgi:hypothetical protein
LKSGEDDGSKASLEVRHIDWKSNRRHWYLGILTSTTVWIGHRECKTVVSVAGSHRGRADP